MSHSALTILGEDNLKLKRVIIITAAELSTFFMEAKLIVCNCQIGMSMYIHTKIIYSDYFYRTFRRTR